MPHDFARRRLPVGSMVRMAVVGFAAAAVLWSAARPIGHAQEACPTGRKDCHGSCIPTATLCCGVEEQECHSECIPETSLCILEPWPGMPSSIPAPVSSKPLGPFLYYINHGVWQWVFRIAVALAVFNGVFGAFDIIRSNGDSSVVEKGKQRFLWSVVGLIILLLSGIILEYLNPFGFQAL